jgi:hypothetical protein
MLRSEDSSTAFIFSTLEEKSEVLVQHSTNDEASVEKF